MGKAYDIFNRKLFSLPKLIILPGVISRQPMLLVKIFPFIFLTDMLKGRIVASVTDKVEQFQREARDVNSIRQKVEQFDMKNAELVSRSGLRRTRCRAHPRCAKFPSVPTADLFHVVHCSFADRVPVLPSIPSGGGTN